MLSTDELSNSCELLGHNADMVVRGMAKHERLSAALRAEIEEGELQGALPSEVDLTDRFDVSRSVVRQALSTLEAEGLITKIHGRGSFVTPINRVHRVVQSLNGLGMQLEDQGDIVATDVLAYDIEPYAEAPVEWGAQQALHLVRLRTRRGQPLAVIDTRLPADLAESLPRDRLKDASLHALLRGQGVILERSRRSVLAIPARESIAGLLGVNTGAPVLLLTGTTFDDQGKAVEVFSTYHRGDRVVFDLETDLS